VYTALDQTFQDYSSFVTTYANADYEESMIQANKVKAEASAKWQQRENHEARLVCFYCWQIDKICVGI
jgi:hypothetical protein